MSNTVIYNKVGTYSGFLGNVLFQTAATIGIAVKNNMDYIFPPKDYYKAFIGPIPQQDCSTMDALDYPEKNYHYDPVDIYPGPNRNLMGYFQSEKYWKHCEELIRSKFKFTDEIINYVNYKYLNNIQPSKTLISIHVRRGDYLNSPNAHPTLNMEYYLKAVGLMEDAIGLPKESLMYVIFSDDHTWCKDNFLRHSIFKDRILFAEGNDQAQDLCFMVACSHNIMANSSFSWWGGYLNNNGDKVVIAPSKEKWYGKDYKHWNLDDLYLSNWILV